MDTVPYTTGNLTDIVELHGGDILKFAGDAILVCWTPTAELDPQVSAQYYITACMVPLPPLSVFFFWQTRRENRITTVNCGVRSPGVIRNPT